MRGLDQPRADGAGTLPGRVRKKRRRSETAHRASGQRWGNDRVSGAVRGASRSVRRTIRFVITVALRNGPSVHLWPSTNKTGTIMKYTYTFLALALAVAGRAQVTHELQVEDDEFNPSTLTINLGDHVH